MIVSGGTHHKPTFNQANSRPKVANNQQEFIRLIKLTLKVARYHHATG